MNFVFATTVMISPKYSKLSTYTPQIDWFFCVKPNTSTSSFSFFPSKCPKKSSVVFWDRMNYVIYSNVRFKNTIRQVKREKKWYDVYINVCACVCVCLCVCMLQWECATECMGVWVCDSVVHMCICVLYVCECAGNFFRTFMCNVVCWIIVWCNVLYEVWVRKGRECKQRGWDVSNDTTHCMKVERKEGSYHITSHHIASHSVIVRQND